MVLTLLMEHADRLPNSPFWSSLVVLPLLPGYLVYLLVTGDIHGWYPGPIGVGGRVTVVSTFSTLIWALLAWHLTKRTREASNKA
jgi:hypothetical protein